MKGLDVTEHKIKIPPIEELDEYERALCESADPADHTALLMRLALRSAGVDPDSDDWYISGHKMESSDPNLVIEEQKLYYRPVVKKIHVIKGTRGRTFLKGKTSGQLGQARLMYTGLGDDSRTIECATHSWQEATMPDANGDVFCSKCMGGPTRSSLYIDSMAEQTSSRDWPKYQAINSYEIKGRGKVITVHMDRWLKAHIEGKVSVRGKYVEVDGEAYILRGLEFSKGLSYGEIVGLQVMKVPVVPDMQGQPCMNHGLFHDDRLQGFIEQACKNLEVDPDRYLVDSLATFRRWSQSYQHVLPHLNEEKIIEWFETAIKQFRHTDEQARIRKSVRDDADNTPFEELVAAADVLNRVEYEAEQERIRKDIREGGWGEKEGQDDEEHEG